MSLLRKALTVAFVTIVPLVMLNLSATAHATESNPPTALPTVTCEKITIDPQPTWGVAFDGTIGAHTGLHLTATHVPGTATSEALIAALTTATGEIHWSITPVWTIPQNPYGVTSGNGPTTSGTLTCHDEPTTTTTEAPTTTTSTSVNTSSTSTSTSVPSTTTTGPCDQFSRGVAPTDMRSGAQACTTTTVTPTTRLGIAIAAKAPTLPFTGSSSRPLGALGGIAVAAGALTLAVVRKRSR